MNIRITVALLLIVLFTACEKKDPDGGITSLTLEVNKTKILNDNDDAIIITVYDQSGNNVSAETDISASGDILASNVFRSATAGQYSLSATANDIISNNVVITVVEDIGLLYAKNVIIEQFTGTWCGFCPRAIHQVSSLLLTQDNVVHIAYHLNDEFDYYLNSNLFNGFGYTGVPSMIADRRITWMGEKNEISSCFDPSRTGISASVSGTEDKLKVDVELTFGKKYGYNIGLGVYLVHDSLVADQKSYYNDDPSSPWYGAGEVFYNFVHDNVMVKNLTDLYGDPVPPDSVDIGSVYETTFQTDSFRCENINHIKAVIFVTYTGGPEKGNIINSAVCDFGSEIELVLADK